MTATATEPAAFSSLDEAYDRLPITSFIESPFNPRKTFNPETLKELADSIASKGVIEPIVVRPWSKHSDKFEIVAGARRYRASQLVGLTHLPAIIRAYTDLQIVEIMAIENGQRDDVPPLEEAAGYKQLLLIDKTYTAQMIAAQIGHTEKYVWDRLRLLDAIDEVKALLSAGAIGVEHAEILAKLKPTEQRRVIARQNGGLFTHDGALEFDDRETTPAALERHKPVSVRELRMWIARNIRFDVQHAAAAAPLDFGLAAQRVEQAEAQPGRGKKVVPITHEHACPYNAADKEERTYGATAWKTAEKDGKPTCEHAVLGVVVAGAHYGDTFHVCIARDKCRTHWAELVKAKEKAAELRESGKGKQAAKVEKQQEARQQDQWKRERKEQEARQRAWAGVGAAVIADAADQVKRAKALTAKQAASLLASDVGFDRAALKKYLGAQWFKNLAAALLLSEVHDFNYSGYNTKKSGFETYLDVVAKPLSLDIKRLEVVRDKHQPNAEPAKASTKKNGKKATAA